MENMIDLTGICVAVLTAIFGIVTYKVWPYIKDLLHQNFTQKKLAEIQKWVKIAVEAAEMIYKESGMGEKKKEYVERFISDKLESAKAYLEAHGFTISWDEINKMIESAVLEMNNTKK